VAEAASSCDTTETMLDLMPSQQLAVAATAVGTAAATAEWMQLTATADAKQTTQTHGCLQHKCTHSFQLHPRAAHDATLWHCMLLLCCSCLLPLAAVCWCGCLLLSSTGGCYCSPLMSAAAAAALPMLCPRPSGLAEPRCQVRRLNPGSYCHWQQLLIEAYNKWL
jgi:hypothetical protein